MSRVLAMLDDSPQAPAVLRVATDFARLLQVEVDAVTVVAVGEHAPESTRSDPTEGDAQPRVVHGEPDTVLAAELTSSDVLLGVLGTRTVLSHPELLGHIARAVVTRSPRPLVLVPPGNRRSDAEHPVVLLPLDGDRRTSTSVADVATLLVDHGAELIVLHVYDSTTAPMFGPERHGDSVVADDFLARHAPGSARRIEMGIGTPATEILDAARRHDVDAIVLGWHQDLAAGRAETLRRVVDEAAVPIVLVPCERPLPLGRSRQIPVG